MAGGGRRSRWRKGTGGCIGSAETEAYIHTNYSIQPIASRRGPPKFLALLVPSVAVGHRAAQIITRLPLVGTSQHSCGLLRRNHTYHHHAQNQGYALLSPSLFLLLPNPRSCRSLHALLSASTSTSTGACQIETTAEGLNDLTTLVANRRAPRLHTCCFTQIIPSCLPRRFAIRP